jgi:hypothetical protein
MLGRPRDTRADMGCRFQASLETSRGAMYCSIARRKQKEIESFNAASEDGGNVKLHVGTFEDVDGFLVHHPATTVAN